MFDAVRERETTLQTSWERVCNLFRVTYVLHASNNKISLGAAGGKREKKKETSECPSCVYVDGILERYSTINNPSVLIFNKFSSYRCW